MSLRRLYPIKATTKARARLHRFLNNSVYFERMIVIQVCVSGAVFIHFSSLLFPSLSVIAYGILVQLARTQPIEDCEIK